MTVLCKLGVRRWPSARARTWFESFVHRAARDSNVVAVVVVGSAVRPRVTSEDLDLLVVCHDIRALKLKTPMEVDVRKVELGSLERDISTGHDLLTWAVRYGKPTLDKEERWAKIVCRWVDRLPLPDVSVCAARANTAYQRMEEMRAVGDQNALNDLNVTYQTHRARGSLAAAGIYPASRPELAGQLRTIGEFDIANDLEQSISARRLNSEDSNAAA